MKTRVDEMLDQLVLEEKFTLKVKDYNETEFPFCIYEDDEFLASFPTKKEATYKLEVLNRLYQEAIMYEEQEMRVDLDEESVIEEADEEEDLFGADAPAEEVPAEEPVAEEVPAEEPVAEEVPTEEPVDENPDAENEEAVLEKEAKKKAINVANGFFYAAENGKYVPTFITPELKADENGEKALREWAEGLKADPTETQKLADILKLDLKGTALSPGMDNWLDEVIANPKGILDVMVLKLDDLLKYKSEETPEEAPAEEAPAEEVPAEEAPAEAPAEEVPAEAPAEGEEEDLFA
jgi:hypothetical protein